MLCSPIFIGRQGQWTKKTSPRKERERMRETERKRARGRVYMISKDCEQERNATALKQPNHVFPCIGKGYNTTPTNRNSPLSPNNEYSSYTQNWLPCIPEGCETPTLTNRNKPTPSYTVLITLHPRRLGDTHFSFLHLTLQFGSQLRFEEVQRLRPQIWAHFRADYDLS